MSLAGTMFSADLGGSSKYSSGAILEDSNGKMIF